MPSTRFKIASQSITAAVGQTFGVIAIDHPKTRKLTPDVINRERGLWLHQFTWLDDNDIGELDQTWNHLVGEVPHDPNAKLVHFTTGTPNMPGHEHDEFADEWRAELESCGT